MPSTQDPNEERFRQAIEASTNPTAQFQVLNYSGEVYFRAFGYGSPPERPGYSVKKLEDLTLPLNIYVDITTPKNPTIYYVQYHQWTSWYNPKTLKPGQTTLPRARILRGKDRDLDLVCNPPTISRKLSWYSRRRASDIQPWRGGNGEISLDDLDLDMTWLAAGFRPASKPTPRLPFSFTSAESQSPSKLYRDQPVRASQTIRPPHIIKPLQTGDDDDDEDEEDDASNASSLSDDLGEGKSYFASVDIAKQLGDALEGTRKDLVAAQAALANKKHSLAFAHNQIRRLRRVSRENRRRHSQKIQKLKHTSKREIMKTDRRHLEEVLVLQKESQVSTADYSQQILTLQDENRDSHQKNVHEIRDLQDQLDVSASRRAEEAQSLKDDITELKATEEKYLKKLESLQDESRRDKQTVAVLQKERAVMDSLAMKFRRTMSACVITGLVSLQFILVAKNLKEVA